MVDIIIPAYNCSKTLPRLLASIGAQTKPEKCIVTIVDDCSTEDIKPIIRDFKKYFNIKLQYIKLEKNLKWPGLVRQEGLNRTNAPYVMFLDSDDFLSPRAVELANREMRSTNADVIIGHFYGEDDKRQWYLLEETQTTWLHGNIYKRAFLEKNDIYFESLYNEDGAFNTESYLLAEKITYLPEPIYFWSYNTSSVTKSKFFAENNYKFFVQSLQKTYSKLFKKSNKEKLYNNLGEHIAVFYKFYNKILCDGVGQKETEEALYEFSNFINVNIFSKIKKSFIVKGYLNKCEEIFIENENITKEDFWGKFNFNNTVGGLKDYESYYN